MRILIALRLTDVISTLISLPRFPTRNSVGLLLLTAFIV